MFAKGVIKMKKFVTILWARVIVLLMLGVFITTTGCVTLQQHHHEGAGMGAVIGGVAGALLDKENPWRGGVIGATIGGVAGATLADISVRASREAAVSGRPVEYRTQDGRGVFHAEPVTDWHRTDAHTRCRKVRERVWEMDRLVRDTVREVCESEKTMPHYQRR
jgi:hypothetical protein